MGRPGLKRTVVCVDCSARRELSQPEARRERWDLWLGGARCAACVVKLEPHLAPLPPPFGPTVASRVIVACSACAREAESSQEYADGTWRPGIHWTSDAAIIQEARDSHARRARDPKHPIFPLPLCPGWDKAGRVVRVEREEIV